MQGLSRLLGIIAIAGFCWLQSSLVFAEKLAALVIGNSAYHRISA